MMIELKKEIHLTERQREVLNLVAKGYTNSEIADIMFITDHTVKAHICAIYELLQVKSRVQLVVKAIQKGILNIEDIYPV